MDEPFIMNIFLLDTTDNVATVARDSPFEIYLHGNNYAKTPKGENLEKVTFRIKF